MTRNFWWRNFLGKPWLNFILRVNENTSSFEYDSFRLSQPISDTNSLSSNIMMHYWNSPPYNLVHKFNREEQCKTFGILFQYTDILLTAMRNRLEPTTSRHRQWLMAKVELKRLREENDRKRMHRRTSIEETNSYSSVTAYLHIVQVYQLTLRLQSSCTTNPQSQKSCKTSRSTWRRKDFWKYNFSSCFLLFLVNHFL